MIVFWFVLLSLASYRLGLMLSQEEGPFRLFEQFRNFFTGDNWLGRGVRCFKCESFWIAFLLSFLLAQSAREFILFWLGASGLALILKKYWGQYESSAS